MCYRFPCFHVSKRACTLLSHKYKVTAAARQTAAKRTVLPGVISAPVKVGDLLNGFLGRFPGPSASLSHVGSHGKPTNLHNTTHHNTLRQGWQQQPSANTKRSKPHRATLKAGLWDCGKKA